MPVIYKKTAAMVQGVCAVEEAEALLAWLRQNPKGKINLRECEHIHTALVQVLMAMRPAISSPPRPGPLADFLALALEQGRGNACASR